MDWFSACEVECVRTASMIYSRPMVNRLPARLLIATLALVVYWMMLFAATHAPGEAIGEVRLWDKGLHFAAYFFLAMLLAWVLGGLIRERRLVYAAALVIIAVYAALDEFLQAFVPGRTADIKDWIADMAGAVCGLIAYALAAFVFAPPTEKP